MRDEHDAALVFVECQRQRLAHLEVEVVGRFVESSSRFGLFQISSASARRDFSPPEKLCAGGGRHVAAEVEAAEVVAQFLAAVSGSDAACAAAAIRPGSCSSWCCAK